MIECACLALRMAESSSLDGYEEVRRLRGRPPLLGGGLVAAGRVERRGGGGGKGDVGDVGVVGELVAAELGDDRAVGLSGPFVELKVGHCSSGVLQGG